MRKSIRSILAVMTLAGVAIVLPIGVGSSHAADGGLASFIRLNNACGQGGNPCIVVEDPEGCCKDGVCDQTADCVSPTCE